jgi:NRAMP (natural resistance-associated macrophage protein)-like metal ion transporter
MRTGTSSLIVAAFVGPGTVLTCASAGVDFGYQLGWVLVFATGATFVLQSYTAGTGILARQGLGEALRAELAHRRVRPLITGLVVLGLWVGTAAFELGNLMGAAAGITALTDVPLSQRALVALIAGSAAVILLLELRVLIRVFAGLVVGMSLLFLVGLAVAPIDWGAALAGLTVPRVPDGGLVRVLALVGTTVVTYNLFLHPSMAKAYWASTDDRAAAWWGELRGMALFLPVGGLVSFSILAVGATLSAPDADVQSAEAFALLLEPVAGSFAATCFGLGLFAAGLTSSLTAPLAAAKGICEIFGWSPDATSPSYRLVWGSVVATGLLLSLVGWEPLPAIIAAQAANGLLLPLVAAFVMSLTLRQDIVSLPYWYHALGIGIVLLCGALGLRTLWWVVQQL